MAAKVSCPYCGMQMADFLLAMHEGNCPKRPTSPLMSTAEAAEWLIREAAEESPVAPSPEANTRGYEILRTGSHEIPPPPPPILVIPPDPGSPEEDAKATALSPEEMVQTYLRPPTGSVQPSNDGLFRPQSNPYFVVPVDLGLKLSRTIAASRQLPWPRNVRSILFTGPRGAGKTSLGFQIAAKLGKDPKYPGNGLCYVTPCSTMQEAAQWWGFQGVSPERGTYYVESGFVRALETPGCTIILDDMNRTENPKVLNPLFLILDNDIREANIDDLGRKIKVADGVIFVATINEGFEYQGTDPIDLALRDRFDQIRVDYPPGEQIQEILIRRTGLSFDSAERLGRFARTLADHPTPDERIFLSMRQMISIGEDIVLGGSIRDAVLFCISAGMSDEAMEKVSAILQTILSDNYMGRVPDWRPWQ